jgi:alpha-tubulin suppressor-like RCC1 family protein
VRYSAQMRALAFVLIAGCGRIGFDSADPAGGEAVRVAVGRRHTCAVVAGRVACWGGNEEGQLGRGDLIDDRTPRWIAELAAIRTLSIAEGSTFALDDAGAIWSWGHAGDRTLGADVPLPRATPDRSPVLPDIAQVSGGTGVCARANGGTVTCWGDADAGQLAIGSTPDFTLPVQSVLSGVIQLSIGTDHGCGIVGGQLYCWGCDPFGQLGIDSILATDVCQDINEALVACSVAPVAVAAAINPIAVSAGRTHTCAIFEDERVRCWGRNLNGELGDGTNNDSALPVPVVGLGAARMIAAGRGHTCALLGDGSGWCWGSGGEGVLGNASYADSNEPVRVNVPVPLAMISSEQSGLHACAVDVANDIWCWGYNDRGQLGDAPIMTATPVRVVLPSSD